MKTKENTIYQVKIRDGFNSIIELHIPALNIVEACTKASEYIIHKRAVYFQRFMAVPSPSEDFSLLKSIFDSYCDMKIISIVELNKTL